MRMRTAWLLTALLAAALPTFAAKPPKVQWTRTFSELYSTAGYSVTQTFDRGYVAVGGTRPDTGAYEVYYVVKTDSAGDSLWHRTDGWAKESNVRSIVQTGDSGYVMAGTATPISQPESSGTYLVRLNSHGGVRWQKIVDTKGVGFSVAQTSDGGFVVSELIPYADSAVCLIKTDSSGNRVWRSPFHMRYGLHAEYIPLAHTTDGGFIVGAKTLIKADSSGNLQWMRTYDSIYAAYSVVQTPDRGFAAAGFRRTGINRPYFDMCLLRTDTAGNLAWKKTYPGTPMGSLGYWVDLGTRNGVADGGLVATGYVVTEERAAGYVVRTLANGDVDWQMMLGDTSPRCIHRTADGGYIITGCSRGKLVLTKLAPDRIR
jgi:hypothetical protein